MMMRRLVIGCICAIGATALAQESDVTQVTTTESGGEDLISQLWFMEDATPLETGQVDLRLGFGWETASAPANRGDSNDDFVVTPAIVWGSCPNVEVSASVPSWVGDGGDKGPLEDGNFDTTVGMLWRVAEQSDPWPAVAVSGSVRVPTGDNSSGVDGELRLILTNEYAGGLRSHVNGFWQTVNGHNNEDRDLRRLPWGSAKNALDWIDSDDGLRHFQWGVVVGMDGPLCGDGAVRWVADYMHRSSHYYGAGDLNLLELGWEWAVSEAHKLGMSMQVGLDGDDETPNFGAGLMYAFSIGL